MPAQPPFSPRARLEGKRLFLLGGTGFLGKVTLSMLLDRFPEIGRVYLMVRPGSGADPEARFWGSVLPSPPFDPLRERFGSALADFLRSKLVIVGGDIVEPDLGYAREEAERIAADIHLLVNCSGRVDFNPPLSTSLRTHVTGTRHTLAFARKMRQPAYVHMSTCFVAGNRSGEIFEDEPVLGYFPRRGQPGLPEFRPEEEIEQCERLGARVREEAEDPLQAAGFRQAAAGRLREEARDPDDEAALRLAVARERKRWVRERLSELGLERARGWGWPNIYTYTKSLGEQLVAAEEGVRRTILRPSIVESAVSFPFPGWNEGFNTSAPLVLTGLKGQPFFPASGSHVLDFIPVDYVAAAVIAVVARMGAEEEVPLVHQLSTGQMNPLTVGRGVTLLGLYKRRHFRTKKTGQRLVNEIAARMEARVISPRSYDRLVAPLLSRGLAAAGSGLDRLEGDASGAWRQVLEPLTEAAGRLAGFVRDAHSAYEAFRPFIVENDYVFRSDRVRELMARIPEAERALIPYEPDRLDWHSYLLNVHFPGLERWVFPRLEQGEGAKTRRVHAHGSLVQMLETAVKLHGGRCALRLLHGDAEESYTYADLGECALRAASFLARQGIGAGRRVALLCENRPEWGMCYFGILRAGAAAILLEADLSTAEVARRLRAGEAAGVILSPELRRRHRGLAGRLAAAGMAVWIWSTDEVLALGDEADERDGVSRLPRHVAPGALASLVFTSGTAGPRKAVQLTHRNLASLVAKVLSVVDLRPSDGMLSVLPLHDPFELALGLLVPLARGAQVTYLRRLSDRSVRKALARGRITAIVGGPGLWEVVERAMLKGVRGKARKRVLDLLCESHRTLRERTGVNLRPLLRLPGLPGGWGRLRYLISAGAPFPSGMARTLRGLGLDLLEGYGLAEAASLITLTRSGSLPPAGVGAPLPGLEVRILNPDRRGVGEIAARGPTIMAGYDGDEEATRAVLVDGWLHTGDLGRLDPQGNLLLSGRVSDVIIGTSGKSVYPDELEAAYAAPGLIRDLSVVGLPDGEGERVACLVVPERRSLDKPRAAGEARKGGGSGRDAARARIRGHFRRVSAGLPPFKRVRVLRFADRALPRTATGRVKRGEVQVILQRLSRDEVAGGPESFAPEAEADTVHVPRPLAAAGSKALDWAQRRLYFQLLKPVFHGRAHVPVHTNFLVAANHCSHLDMGLVKMALGESGRGLVAMAAADYFFGSKATRTFFENFTNLVPIDRGGSLRESFETASGLLKEGRNVLIFPEGTRSRTGLLQPFRRGLGFLVLHTKVGVLPIHLDTFGAMPPGALVPRRREVTARIGPFLSPEFIERLTSGLSAGQAKGVITSFVQWVIERLRDGEEPDLRRELARRRGAEKKEAAVRVPFVAVRGEDE